MHAHVCVSVFVCFVIVYVTSGDAGGADQRLGTCPARDVQAVGQGQPHVHAAARLSVRHVVRVPHGSAVQSGRCQLDVADVLCPLRHHVGHVRVVRHWLVIRRAAEFHFQRRSV